ncbi:MAG: mechanosensitive ion channel, partial [Roseovarius sp.]|nr:mechanosensitive ion channel [Roseovarius sp.]
RRTLRRSVRLASFAILAVAAAFTFASSLTGLAVSLGVAGAAAAFVLQEVLASGVGWVQIMAGKICRTGDRVRMGGVIGDVIQINAFLTTLMEICGDWANGDQYTGRIVRVPNSSIYKQPKYNFNPYFDYV